MLYVGIDIAKNKHDFYIMGEHKEQLVGPITVKNNAQGFAALLQAIHDCLNRCTDSLDDNDPTRVQIGMESTGHYGYNLLHFLYKQGFTIYLMNPKQTSDMHKASTLRKTKTDKVDAKMLATIVYAERDTLTPYTIKSYHIEQLKSLTRYRMGLVEDSTRLKVSVKRLVNILFPEYDTFFSNLHGRCSYAILKQLPSKEAIAGISITRLTSIITKSSRGCYGRELAERIHETARHSIGLTSPVQSSELQDTIERIHDLSNRIEKVDQEITKLMCNTKSQIITIPGIGHTLAAAIVSEIGDVRRFSHPDKLVAFAGISPSIYQSGQYTSTHAKMEKRGSRQLRYSIMRAAESVARYNPYFAHQLHKKRCEGKAYRVAISHVARNLLRLIYRMELTGEVYRQTET